MTHDELSALRSEVRQLALRVERLEADRLGSAADRQSAPPGEPSSHLRALVERRQATGAAAVLPPATPPTTPPPATPDRPSPWKAASVLPVTKPARDARSLEWLVGGRLYAILGALVVVAGAGLFLKLAWDQGWFEVLPDAWKCILAAAFGGVLLVAGEVLRRRWGAVASIGCSAAGLGVIYAAAYAAYGAFGLVSHQVGFMMLAGTAALGVGIGARARLVSVAIVSMVGGYFAPLLFWDADPSPMVLPAYLLALLGTALALCAWLRARFVALRTIAWWGTVFFGGIWTLANGDDHPVIACGFLVLAWGAMQSELVVSAIRSSPRPDDESDDASPMLGVRGWRAARPFVVSFSTSVWAGLLGGLVMSWWQDAVWMAPAAGFAVTAVLSQWLAGHLGVLRDVPRNERERLGAVFAAQAGVFLLATISLGLAGWLEVVAWIGMGAASVVAGRWIRSRALDVYGIIALGIATARLVLFDKLANGPLQVGTDVGGLFLSRWSALIAVCGGAWLVSGELIRRSDPERRGWFGGSIALQIIGALLLLVTPADELTSGVSIAWFWLAASVLAFGLGVLLRRSEWRWTGGALVIPALMAGGAAYEVLDWTLLSAPPLMHAALWFSAAVAVAWLVMGAVQRRVSVGPESRAMGVGFIVAGACVAFAASSAEVARVVPQLTDTETAQRAAVSIWWGLCAVGLLAGGLVRRVAPLRYAALGLLGVATLKAVVFDLVDVSAGWRVASFVLLGVLMIGVAAVYTRVAKAFDELAEPGDQFSEETETPTGGADGAEASAGS